MCPLGEISSALEYICVLIQLRNMCLHFILLYVPSCYYICVLILISLCIPLYVSSYYICIRIQLYVLIILCVLILPYMCPHTTIFVLILLYVSSYYCVLTLSMCPHAMYVSSCYVCVLILLYMYAHTLGEISSALEEVFGRHKGGLNLVAGAYAG